METIRFITQTPGETASGKKWLRYDIEFLSGDKISTFDTKMIRQFKPGDNVEIEVDRTGQYPKLLNMTLAQPLQGMPSTEVPTIKNTPKVRSNRTATEISVWDAIRYSIKLFDSESFKGGFVEAQEHILQAYQEFLGRLK